MIPAPDILVTAKHTSTSSDMLSATELAKIPKDGTILTFIASTVNTATFQGPGQNPAVPAVAQPIALWANGVPQVKDLIPYKTKVKAGNAPTFVLGGTTGTVYAYHAYYANGGL